MDGRHFDSLTRTLASAGWTRRAVASSTAKAALALPAGAAGPDAEAKKRGRGKGKGKKKKPKPCQTGAIRCDAGCVDPRSDALHCGGCDRRCGQNIACVNGACRGGGCPSDQILCGALCVDPDANEQHCGGCGNACQGDLTCVGGQCGCASGTRCGDRCVDVQTDTDHCGSCGNGCDPGETCVGGQCTPSSCGSGQRDCGNGLCIPDDDEHCCNLADCGGQFSALFCNATTHRCECEIAGWGRCTGQDRFSCAPCCPGSAFDLGERCAGANDERVCVDRTLNGCRCPDATPYICSAFNQTKCTFDQNRDPRVCGRFCEACAPGWLCCGGLCHNGCPPSTGGSCASGPCNADCSPCQEGSTCCNFGAGPRCYEDMGTICYPP